MAFAIQWTGSQGLASTRRKDPVDALKYAIEMLGKGYADVVIVDLAEKAKRMRRPIFAISIWTKINKPGALRRWGPCARAAMFLGGIVKPWPPMQTLTSDR